MDRLLGSGQRPRRQAETGDRRRVSDQEGALDHARNQEKAITQGTYVAPNKITVGGYLTDWLRDSVTPRLRTRTAQGYAGVVHRYLIPALGSIPLSELRPARIEAFSADLQRQGLAPATNKQTHVILKSALKRATRLGLLAVNPCASVDAPRLRRTEVPIISREQAKVLADTVGDDAFGVAVKLALYTGLRRSELLAVKWSDLDLTAGTLSVRRSLHVAKGGAVVIEQPKSDHSRRQEDLSPTVVAVLRAWKAAQAEQRLRTGPLWDAAGWVLTNGVGRHLMPDSLTHDFVKLARKLGLTVTLHGLRHVHARGLEPRNSL